LIEAFGGSGGNDVPENVAVLFTDLVGSTELGSRLPPAGADELRYRHFAILRQAMAKTDGTEVKNLGDGLMVVFSASSAALSCAVAMQRSIELHNRKAETPLGLRIGVSAGEATRDDNDFFGEPVIEAARLCGLAEGGQILATQLARSLAGRRSPHSFSPLGALDLKGLPEPVETVSVVWEPEANGGAAATVPLPSRLGVRPGVGVVGREYERTSILQAYKRAAAGEGCEVVLICGEAGVGKTTLAADAARQAFDDGAYVLLGHCDEDLSRPYQLLAEALSHLVTHGPEEMIADHVAEHGSELARVAPALARRVPNLPQSRGTDAETERYLLFAAVVGMLSQAARNHPVLLVLDDLAWADKDSLQLLRHVVASSQELRLAILGTYRDTELSHSHPFLETLGALRRETRLTRVQLSGLDDVGVLSFMEAAAGHVLDSTGVELAQAVYRETDGNPFFVGEVLRDLAETGAIYQNDVGRWMARDDLEQVSLPDSVREVIGGRVSRLGDAAHQTLALAAVIGRNFDLELVSHASGTAEDDLLDVLDAASAAALVQESDTPGRYGFRHALIQHTLYEDLGHTRRARAHRRVAEALEVICDGQPSSRVGELAHHWSCATQPVDLAKALDYSRRAAEEAMGALAPQEAVGYYVQALELDDRAGGTDPVARLDLLIGLGIAQHQVGDPAYRETLLDASTRARHLHDTKRLVAAALANNRGYFSALGKVDTDRVDTLELAIEALREECPDRALLLASLCSELTYGSSLERRRSLAAEAEAIAHRMDDDTTVVRVQNLLAVPLDVPPLLDECLARSREALERSRSIGDPVLVYWANALHALAAARSSDVEQHDRCLDVMGSLAEQLNQPTLTWTYTYRSATRSLLAGDTDEAERLATEALQLATDSGQPDAASFFGAQLISVSFQRGTLGGLIPVIQETAKESPGLPAFVAALAQALAEAGRTDEASQLLHEFAARDFDFPMDIAWLSGMTLYADAAIWCKARQQAEPLLDRLAPWDHLVSYSGASAEGPVSHYLGGLASVLERYDEADAYFARSAAFNERVRAKFFAARTDLSWGAMLMNRSAPGDVERARQLLDRARSTAAERGYSVVEQRAATALRQLTA
jgi:class 3 adenylate cyclase